MPRPVASLIVPTAVLPPTEPLVVEKLTQVQAVLLDGEQVPIFTEHVIHAGMYARTITMPPDTRVIGAFMKIPTMVIVVGKARVLAGRDWAEIEGYCVLPASANRKQVFDSFGPLIITMIFPTQARTVAEAEAEFTQENELLLSRRQDLNKVTITGEN